jgi:hypothetical protein
MSRRLTTCLVAVASIAFAAAAAADRRATVLASQPFVAGALPGSPGITIKTKGSDGHCGGVALTATVKKSKKPDKHLAAVFAVKFPTGLDFSPTNEAKRKKSAAKFDAWYDALDVATRAAGTHYRDVIGNADVPVADRVAAAARIVQVARWSAHMVARAPMPKNVGEYPEAQAIYCDTLADKAETLEMFAIDASAACRDLATKLAAGAGWWDDVCAP